MCFECLDLVVAIDVTVADQSRRWVTLVSGDRRGLPGRRAAGGRPLAGLEFVEKLLTAMIRVVSSGAGLTRLLTGQLPCV
jgi:hypothetical protein